MDGRPVITHVIDTLKSLDFISKVYVSTDDSAIADIATAAGALCLGPRAAELANDKAGFAELIHQDIPRHVKHCGDGQVLFALATAALVPADIYQQAWQIFGSSRPDILMSCEKAHPFWAMTQKADGFWWPIFPEKVLTNSQDLPPSLIDAGLFY
ncbi:MAG: hypothetical protein VW600_12345, partial [Ferrovibrio sp.]